MDKIYCTNTNFLKLFSVLGVTEERNCTTYVTELENINVFKYQYTSFKYVKTKKIKFWPEDTRKHNYTDIAQANHHPGIVCNLKPNTRPEKGQFVSVFLVDATCRFENER